MFDDYFEEVNAKKRKKILKSLEAGPGEEEALEQIRTLYNLRYKTEKKGKKSVDQFLGVLVSLRSLVGIRPSVFNSSRSKKLILGDLHTLCLDRTDEFSPEILYREMCNLISLYIFLCYDDRYYHSAALGFGKMSDERLNRKIRTDLNVLWDQIPKYVEVKDEYLILRRAMDDMMDQKLIEEEDDDDDDDDDD